MSSDTPDRRLLLIDDDRDFAASLANILRLEGYHVQLAYSAAEAEQVLADYDAQVALVDIRLGRDNGVELLPRLKRRRPDLMLLMVTAYASLDTAIAVLHEGVQDYLRKPFSFEELDTALNRCFERRRQQQEQTAREQQYQVLYDEHPALVVSLDADNRIVSVNRYGAERLGYRVEELLGLPVARLYPEQRQAELKAHLETCRREPARVQRWQTQLNDRTGLLLNATETARLLTRAGEPTLLKVSEMTTGSTVSLTTPAPVPAAGAAILLVENDPGLLGLLALELELAGYQVHAYASAEAALDHAPTGLALAVLDYRLSGLDGLELLARLRRRQSDLPALLISSELTPAELPGPADSTRLLRKPFTQDGLLDTVAELLSL